MKTLSVFAVLAFAGSAMAMDTFAIDRMANVPMLNTSAQKPAHALTAEQIQAQHGARDFSIADPYRVGAAWGNLSGGAARWVNNPAIDPSLNTFDGNVEPYATGANTQLGWPASVVEFEGAASPTSKFIQVSIFRPNGGAIGANSAGFPILYMSIGEGIFVGDPVNLINVNEPNDIVILDVFMGFFNGATFIGGVDGIDLSTSSEIGAFGGVNLGATVVTEMFLFVEYEVVPAPGAFALIGLAGLAATRRRR